MLQLATMYRGRNMYEAGCVVGMYSVTTGNHVQGQKYI